MDSFFVGEESSDVGGYENGEAIRSEDGEAMRFEGGEAMRYEDGESLHSGEDEVNRHDDSRGDQRSAVQPSGPVLFGLTSTFACETPAPNSAGGKSFVLVVNDASLVQLQAHFMIAHCLKRSMVALGPTQFCVYTNPWTVLQLSDVVKRSLHPLLETVHMLRVMRVMSFRNGGYVVLICEVVDGILRVERFRSRPHYIVLGGPLDRNKAESIRPMVFAAYEGGYGQLGEPFEAWNTGVITVSASLERVHV